MDTEEDMPRPNELQDGTMAKVNALRDLLSQIGDPDAAHDAGVIDDDEYVERKARKLAYTAAVAAYGKGEAPDVDKLLEQMREKVAEPSQTETNTANIDYLMMTVGGGTVMAVRVKAATTVAHSKNYDKVRRYYERGLWTKAMVHRAVDCKWITCDEYEEIVGEEYAEEV